MTTKKSKKILPIIAIIFMLAFISNACSKNPTAAETTKQIEEASGPQGETATPQIPADKQDENVKLKIDATNGLSQFKGLYYKSGAYNISGFENTYLFTFTARIYDNYIQFEDGVKFYADSTNVGSNYYLEGGPRDGKQKIFANVSFDQDGYLTVKFENYSKEIKYALSEDNIENNDEISQDGSSIPEVFWGIYDAIVNDYHAVTPATVSSNYVKYHATYYLYDYIGNNTWYIGTQHNDIVKQFFRNEKGQRICYEILANYKYTNVFVHRDDLNK